MANSRAQENKTTEFFMSANGGSGFRTYQSEILDSDKLDRLYILKGGPGTGKSTFMKKALETAINGGAEARIFRCSSDPDSIDAIYAVSGKRRIAITDGTAPHERNALLPGAVDQIIDLGEFWNAEVLSQFKKKISALGDSKRDYYQRGYAYLNCAEKTQGIIRGIYEDGLLWDKISRSATSFVRNFSDLGEPKSEKLMLSSYGISGERRLNTDLSHAKVLISLSGDDEACSAYLLRVFENLGARTHCIAIESPLRPDLLESVMLPLHSISFVPEKYLRPEDAARVAKKINTRRFYDADLIKRHSREIKELREILKKQIDFALEYFSMAGGYHFELETVYRSAMNFDRENEFTDVFCKKLTEELF